MDLTVKIDDATLNIRVAVLFQTPKGYILEKHERGYFFPVGGRVKISESSEEAAKREVLEETGIEIESLKMVSVIENFYSGTDSHVHEICFVYAAKSEHDIVLHENLSEHTLEEMLEMDIRPAIIKEVLQSEDAHIRHLINK